MTSARLDLIDQFAAHLRLTGRSGYTIETWTSMLQRCHDQLPYGLDEAHGDDLLGWLGQPGWTAKTRASYRSGLRAFYRWACDPGDPQLRSDPTQWLPSVRVQRGVPNPCSDAELARILATASGQVWLWALLAAYQGARCIEIGRLEREHVTEQATALHGKGDKPRSVPTHPDVWRVVQELPAGPVARGRGGVPINGRYISRTSIRYLHEILDMPTMGLHRLRHWYLTNVYRVSKDLRATQRAAGHASPDTTAGYVEVADETLPAAVRALPRLATPGPSAAAGEAP